MTTSSPGLTQAERKAWRAPLAPGVIKISVKGLTFLLNLGPYTSATLLTSSGCPKVLQY